MKNFGLDCLEWVLVQLVSDKSFPLQDFLIFLFLPIRINLLAVCLRSWQVRAQPDRVKVLGPLGTLYRIDVFDKECHPGNRAFLVRQLIPQPHQILLQRLIDPHNVRKEEFDTFVEINEVVDGVPPELIGESLAQGLIDFSCCGRLIKRVDKALVHLARAGLVNREAELHQESFKGFQNRAKHFVKLVAGCDTDHIAEDLAADPDNVFEISVPISTPLQVLALLDRVEVIAH